MAIDRDTTVKWMSLFADAIGEHRQALMRLDTAIGDGDHGANMDRGMQKVVEKLAETEPTDAGAALKTTAMTLISTVGGAAGPLYGTLFLALGSALAGYEEVELPDYAAAWRKAVDGVQARGRAVPGDKTMVDALVPAVEALEEATELDAGLRAAVTAAEQGVHATTPLVARRGRASYLGERSAGHQDPGATSSYYLIRTAAEAFADERSVD